MQAASVSDPYVCTSLVDCSCRGFTNAMQNRLNGIETSARFSLFPLFKNWTDFRFSAQSVNQSVSHASKSKNVEKPKSVSWLGAMSTSERLWVRLPVRSLSSG